jgi:hypothetical protein
LIENESKVSLAVKPPNLPIPDHLASFVQSPVRVLGANTAVCRRRLRPDEEKRLAKASQTISMSASVQLPFPLFSSIHINMLLCLPCFRLPMAGSPSFRPLLLRRVSGWLSAEVMEHVMWQTSMFVPCS